MFWRPPPVWCRLMCWRRLWFVMSSSFRLSCRRFVIAAHQSTNVWRIWYRTKRNASTLSLMNTTGDKTRLWLCLNVVTVFIFLFIFSQGDLHRTGTGGECQWSQWPCDPCGSKMVQWASQRSTWWRWAQGGPSHRWPRKQGESKGEQSAGVQM